MEIDHDVFQVSRAIVDKCFELGINFFDTAESYGMGASEKLLGEALQGRRKDAIVATKFGNCVVSKYCVCRLLCYSVYLYNAVRKFECRLFF